MSTFGERLREARESKKFSQHGLARATGITQGTISQWKKGLYILRDRAKAQALADVLGVTPEWLLYGKGIAAPKTEPKPAAPMPPAQFAKPKDPDTLVYKAEDGYRLDAINLCIRHIREMKIDQKDKLQIHKALTYYRDSIERTILFGE